MKYDNVYTLEEEHSHRFYQVPKELFIDEEYKCMNSDSKMLYSVLLDRKELSRKNNWVDKYNQVYLIYTRENLSELLGISVRSVQRAFNTLKELDLIKEVRQGLTKPNKIYICRTKSQYRQGHDKLAYQEVSNSHTSDTNISDTEKIKRYTITSNGDSVLFLYDAHYNYKYQKEHPTVTKKQLDYMEFVISEYTDECGLYSTEWDKIIYEHFKTISDKNNGSALALFTGDLNVSPLRRIVNEIIL